MNKLILSIALTTFTATSALAETSFQTVDTDANGGISYTEAVNAGMPWSEEQFKNADQNADGVLDEAEFKAALL